MRVSRRKVVIFTGGLTFQRCGQESSITTGTSVSLPVSRCSRPTDSATIAWLAVWCSGCRQQQGSHMHSLGTTHNSGRPRDGALIISCCWNARGGASAGCVSAGVRDCASAFFDGARVLSLFIWISSLHCDLQLTRSSRPRQH